MDELIKVTEDFWINPNAIAQAEVYMGAEGPMLAYYLVGVEHVFKYSLSSEPGQTIWYTLTQDERVQSGDWGGL